MKDPVCGMQVDPAKAAGTSEYQGTTYYFCSKGCKTKFDANPGQVRQVTPFQGPAVRPAPRIPLWLPCPPSLSPRSSTPSAA